jgi:single-strand DNA-binding protein
MYNKIIIAGNLSKDIEIRYSQSGSAIANTAIATTRKFKGADGQQKEEVLFVDVTFFGRSAEVANQYLRKGSKVLLDGRLKLDQWTAKDGSKRSKHSVSVESMQMLDSRADGQTTAPSPQPHQAPTQEAYTPPPRATDPTQSPQVPQMDESDEIPF